MKKAPSTQKLLKAAVEAAHASGDILAHHFGKTLRVREKAGAGLVTDIDIASEKAAMRILKKSFPDFGFLTEESGIHAAQSAGRWVIDPLDGTTNYIHKFPMFCVSIAAEWEGEVVVGVIYHPILKETYTAVRGKGAFVNGKRIHVSSTSRLNDSLLTTGFTYRKDEWLHAEMQAFENLSAVARAVRRPGSAALDLAYTARGVFDGFWERRLSPWDVAAGGLLIKEAGGKVTDFKGNDFALGQLEILASNKKLHRPLLSKIAQKVKKNAHLWLIVLVFMTGFVSNLAQATPLHSTELIQALRQQIQHAGQGSSTSVSFDTLLKKWSDEYGTPAVSPLLQLSSDQKIPDSQRYIALMGASKLGGSAITHLITPFLKDRSWMMRTGALRALSALQTSDINAAVLPLLHDSALVVRLEAIQAIEKLRPPGAEKALIDALKNPDNYHHQVAQWVPQRALKALQKLEARETIPALKPYLDHSHDPALQKAVLETLQSLSGKAVSVEFKNRPIPEQVQEWKKSFIQ